MIYPVRRSWTSAVVAGNALERAVNGRTQAILSRGLLVIVGAHVFSCDEIALRRA